MTDEDKISNLLCENMHSCIQEKSNFNFPINIGHKKKILIGTTCGVNKNKPKLLFQSAEQDIVIYLRDDNNEYKFEGINFFQKFRGSLSGDKILIPLVIFEVKYKNVITHSVRNYSEIARMIKNIFPFCMYNFLLLNVSVNPDHSSDKIYMASKYFDRVIHKNGYAVNNHIHSETVAEMCDLIHQRLTYLKEERFFGLTNLL